ncbi:hypothetical protein LCGC14_1860800, partial [marine sediment metagenome]
ESGNRLWTVDITNNKFIHIQLGPNNHPTVTPVTNTGESGMLTPQHYFPVTDFGYPNVKKQLRSMELFAYGVDAENTIQFMQSRDGGNPLALGSAKTSAGLMQVTSSSNLQFYTISGGVRWTLVDGTNDPRFSSFIVRASLLPDKAVRAGFTIDTRLKYADGAQPEWDGPKALSNLRALEGAAPTKFRDTGGTQDDALVNSVTIRETFVDAARTDYLLDLVVTSWEI